jgi:pyruvate dehydrogenase E1 component
MEQYASFALQAQEKEMSTTMAAVRLLSRLLKAKEFGKRLVPIVADEARTFGMDSLFRQIGIYAPEGQLYEPEDAESLSYYKESKDGQLLEEGITEAGAISSWTAAATAYSAHNTELLPVYIFYSMFGFQRVGDLIWAAADQRARGFLFGATAGRTTLSGEGLQHQDGSSLLAATAVPNCRAYDPAYAYELAVIMEHGMARMIDQQLDEFFYITLMNESYSQPDMPAGVEEDIVKGLYHLQRTGDTDAPRVKLIGAGTLLREVILAADILDKKFGIQCDIYSATSFNELAREAAEIDRAHRLRLENTPPQSHVVKLLGGAAPVIAVTDYVRAYAQQISPYVSARFVALGTDGFGRSANRLALRRFFEVDHAHIALAAVDALAQEGHVDESMVANAINILDIETLPEPPWTSD